MSTSLLTDTALTVGGQVFKNVIGTSYSPGTGTTTITAAMMIRGYIDRGMDNVTGTSKVDEVDSAANIVAAIPDAEVNSSFSFTINVTGAVNNTKKWTLSNGTTASAGTTLVGYTEAIPGEGLQFLVRVTNATSGSEAVTVTASAIAKTNEFVFSDPVTVVGPVYKNCPVFTITGSNFTAEQQTGIIERTPPSSSTVSAIFALGADVVASIADCRVNSSIDFFVKNTSTSTGVMVLNVQAGNDQYVTFQPPPLRIYANQMRKVRMIVNNITSGSEAVTYYDLGMVTNQQVANKSLYVNKRLYIKTTPTEVSSSTSGINYTIVQLQGGLIIRTLTAQSLTDNLLSAYNVIYALPLASVGSSFTFIVINKYQGSTRTLTINPGGGNTIVTQAAGGHIVIPNGEGRVLTLVITNKASGSEAVTVYDTRRLVYN